MNLREALLYEIDHAPDEVLNILLSILRTPNRSNPDQPIAPVASQSHHYPPRGLPLEIAEDFDEPMTDLWDAPESLFYSIPIRGCGCCMIVKCCGCDRQQPFTRAISQRSCRPNFSGDRTDYLSDYFFREVERDPL